MLDADDALHQAAATVLGELWDAGEEIVVPSIAYGETMVRPLDQGGAPLERANAFFASQTIVAMGAAEALEAARLRGVHRPWLRMPDALVLATASLRRASALTADARWREVSPRVRVVSAGRER